MLNLSQWVSVMLAESKHLSQPEGSWRHQVSQMRPYSSELPGSSGSQNHQVKGFSKHCTLLPKLQGWTVLGILPHILGDEESTHLAASWTSPSSSCSGSWQDQGEKQGSTWDRVQVNAGLWSHQENNQIYINQCCTRTSSFGIMFHWKITYLITWELFLTCVTSST